VGRRVSPNLRRAFHNALDIVLDALAEEEATPKRKRARVETVEALPEGVTAEEIAASDARLRRAGFRKKAA